NVGGVAVEDATHHDDGASGPNFVAENFRAVRQREDGLGGIEAYLAAIDVEGGDDFDVLRFIRADSSVHQPDISAVAGRPSIKVDALEKRTGTVPDSHDGNSDFVHYRKKPKLAGVAQPGQESCHHIAIFAERNPGGEGDGKEWDQPVSRPAQAANTRDFD